MKTALYIQSGGPTTVINASAFGVISACKEHPEAISGLYAARYGTVGLLNDQLVDVFALPSEELERLPQTPSSAFGSCRYRIADGEAGVPDYECILATLKKNNIGYIFYNGGNGTLRACRDLKHYLDSQNYVCNIIAIPKTVDNDIYGIDHAPGFPSAARHVAITVAELAHDIKVYDTGLITVLEVMGRNTGWLAAATMLCTKQGNGPDLIYTPESVFRPGKFIEDVRRVYLQKGKCLAVVAEGVKTSEGKYLFEYCKDSKGNPQLNMGGITPYLTALLNESFDCKIRGIDLGLMQRCGMHTASEMDVEEAIRLGRMAVDAALLGETGKLVALRRLPGVRYCVEEILMDLDEVAKYDAEMPKSYINADENYITDAFLDYIEPLVAPLPCYASLDLQQK